MNVTITMPYCYHGENSIRDACTPQPGEIVFNTMTYRSSHTVQRENNIEEKESVCKDKVLKQDNSTAR